MAKKVIRAGAGRIAYATPGAARPRDWRLRPECARCSLPAALQTAMARTTRPPEHLAGGPGPTAPRLDRRCCTAPAGNSSPLTDGAGRRLLMSGSARGLSWAPGLIPNGRRRRDPVVHVDGRAAIPGPGGAGSRSRMASARFTSRSRRGGLQHPGLSRAWARDPLGRRAVLRWTGRGSTLRGSIALASPSGHGARLTTTRPESLRSHRKVRLIPSARRAAWASR